MRDQPTKNVALLIETSRTYGRDLLDGVRRYMDRHARWSVYAELRSLDSPAPPWLADWKGDGILARSSSQEMLDTIRDLNVPSVELRATRLKHTFPFVGVDNTALGQLAAEHLLDKGLRHFGVYALTTESFFEERRDSFVAAIDARGFSCAHITQEPGREQPSEWSRQQAALVDWVRTLPKPCGVMACTDQLGFWLLEACRAAGVAVPEEVAVLGVENDDTLASISSPPLSSVRLNGATIGYEAAALLDRMMNGEAAPAEPVLIAPKTLVARQSTDVVAVDDPELAAALRFIRENAVEGIRIPDVLEHVSLSRSSLERRMKQTLGRSPREEIERVKLEHARRLIESTDFTLAEIALRSGFEQPQRFSERFRAVHGVSPSEWKAGG